MTTKQNESTAPHTAPSGRKYNHYYRPFPWSTIDVYRLLEVYDIDSPAFQHAIKKLLAAGKRGAKDAEKDVREVVDSLLRWLEMRVEDRELETKNTVVSNSSNDRTDPGPNYYTVNGIPLNIWPKLVSLYSNVVGWKPDEWEQGTIFSDMCNLWKSHNARYCLSECTKKQWQDFVSFLRKNRGPFEPYFELALDEVEQRLK